jgi:hypothetical protein
LQPEKINFASIPNGQGKKNHFFSLRGKFLHRLKKQNDANNTSKHKIQKNTSSDKLKVLDVRKRLFPGNKIQIVFFF